MLRLVLTLLVATGLLWSVPLSSDAQILGNDALPYAEALQSGELRRILTPHHPGTQALALLLFKAGQALGLWAQDFAGALSALRWVSALGAGATAAWLWAFSTRRLERWSGLALALAFAASAGNWLYGAVGETYLPAAFALCGLLAGLIEAQQRGQSPALLKAAAWLFLACALRQDAVLVAPILLLLAPPRRALAILGLAALASLGFYFWAYVYSAAAGGFLPWLRGLANTGLWGGALSLERFQVSLVVSQHALHYGVRFGGTAALWSYGLTGLAAVMLLWFGRRGRGAVPTGHAASTVRPLLALSLFVLLRLLFFTWWQPSNMEYHTTQLLPLFLAAALLLGRGYGHVRWQPRALALWAWWLMLALGNYRFLIAPNRGSTLQERAHSALTAAGPGALAISLDSFAHFMLLRDAPGLARRDASPWLSGADPNSASAHLEAVRQQLAKGGSVILLHEIDLMPRLRFAAHPLDQAALGQLMQLASSNLPLRSAAESGPGQLYALVLQP